MPGCKPCASGMPGCTPWPFWWLQLLGLSFWVGPLKRQLASSWACQLVVFALWFSGSGLAPRGAQQDRLVALHGLAGTMKLLLSLLMLMLLLLLMLMLMLLLLLLLLLSCCCCCCCCRVVVVVAVAVDVGVGVDAGVADVAADVAVAVVLLLLLLLSLCCCCCWYHGCRRRRRCCCCKGASGLAVVVSRACHHKAEGMQVRYQLLTRLLFSLWLLGTAQAPGFLKRSMHWVPGNGLLTAVRESSL